MLGQRIQFVRESVKKLSEQVSTLLMIREENTAIANEKRDVSPWVVARRVNYGPVNYGPRAL